MFKFSRPRKRNWRKPCHCLASPNSGSTYTERFRIALRGHRTVRLDPL
jgi:hypothetical protein